jgi:hypothetical protein
MSALEIGWYCPVCGEPAVVRSIDYEAGSFRCGPQSAGHVPASQLRTHAIPVPAPVLVIDPGPADGPCPVAGCDGKHGQP